MNKEKMQSLDDIFSGKAKPVEMRVTRGRCPHCGKTFCRKITGEHNIEMKVDANVVSDNEFPVFQSSTFKNIITLTRPIRCNGCKQDIYEAEFKKMLIKY